MNVANGPDSGQLGMCLLSGHVMYDSVEVKNRYTINASPENVYLSRGQRLRFQLINSRFPVPIDIAVVVLRKRKFSDHTKQHKLMRAAISHRNGLQ